MRQFFTIFLKTLLYLFLTVLVLGMLALLALQLPAVQTRLAQKGADWLSEKLQFPVTIEGVSIKWFDSLTLEKLTIQDRQGQPMIQVGRLDADYTLRTLLDSSAHNLHLDEIVLYRPDVRMIKNPVNGDTNLDDFIARIGELTANPNAPKTPGEHNVPFTVAHIHLVDGAYTLEDPREPRMNDPRSFDFNHFTLQHLTAEVSNFLILGDTIAFDARGLRGNDRGSGLKIRSLDTDFLYCNTKMELLKLNARIGNSIVRQELSFLYDNPSALGDFNKRVLLHARFRDSKIQSKDLGYFSDYLRSLNETWLLTGVFTGTVGNFRLQHTDLRFGPGGRSRIAGDIAWKGLPDMANTTVDFAFDPSVVNMADIRQYYPDTSFNHTIQKLGTVAFNATFKGAFDDFKTNGTFRTSMGNVSGDLALKLADKSEQTTYRANLRTENLNLGQLIDKPKEFGRVDGVAKLMGHGTKLERAIADFDGTFNQFGWQGYAYQNVAARGNLQQALFQGQLHINDPNLAFDLDGEFNLKNPEKHYNLRGLVQHADLRALGFVRDSLDIKTTIDVALEGSKLDDIVGRATFSNTALLIQKKGKRSLNIDQLALASTIEPARDSMGTQRYFSLDSDFLTARFQGNFQPQRTIDDLTRLAKEYQLRFEGDAAGMQAYYAKKRQQAAQSIKAKALTDRRYGIDYQFITKQSVPLFAFLNTPVYMAQDTRLEGRFTEDNTSFLTATMRTDSLHFGTIGLGRSDLDLTTSKLVYSDDVLASVVISSKRQLFTKVLPTRNLQIEGSWDVDHIDFTSSLEQADSSGRYNNHADLNGELRFKGDAIDLTFRQSKLRVLDSDWVLNPQSLIRKVGDNYTIRNLSLLNADQLIRVSGKISADSSDHINAQAQNFLLASLNSVLNTKMAGTLNGTVDARSLYGTPIVESALSVSALAYNDAPIGDLRSQGTWDPQTQRVNLNASLNRDGTDVLTLAGTLDPQQQTNPLAVKAQLNGMNLVVLEPFTKDIFSNLGGTAEGQLTITGKLSAPILKGEVGIQNGHVRFDYLKTDFTFADKIYFGENDIVARQLVLRDPLGNTAQLRGGVYHDGFKYVTLGFDLTFKNFRIMNTTATDNDAFYGQAFVTGKAELSGPTSNLQIRANATSNKNTRIYIPLDGATTVAEDDQVRFVSLRGPNAGKPLNATTTQSATPDNGPDLSRIQMDFNFSITPDAYCEIQLDRQTGDIIKANGQGQIGMKIDTKGDFAMTGRYEIQKGDYTFTFQNILNKQFKIQPNSSISWTGDPYGALLNVTAAYTQYTSLAPLLPAQTVTPDQGRRYPVDLLIKLTGELDAPTISYDLDIKEYPTASTYRQAVTAFEARLQSNDQELTRQVSSVLLFNQLLPEGTSLFDQGQVNSGVANSVSELISNQINRLASNLGDNIDLGVSIGGFTSNTQNDNLLNNLQLRFSYRLLNDRLRISRDGGFTYGQSQYNAASLLGEWTLEYFITPDGHLRAKVYNRNQQSILSQYNLTSTITPGGGISLLYTRSFNRIFGNKRTTPGLVPVTTSESAPSASTTQLTGK